MNFEIEFLEDYTVKQVVPVQYLRGQRIKVSASSLRHFQTRAAIKIVEPAAVVAPAPKVTVPPVKEIVKEPVIKPTVKLELDTAKDTVALAKKVLESKIL